MAFETVPKDPDLHEQFVSVYKGGFYISAEIKGLLDLSDAEGVVPKANTATGTLRFEFVPRTPSDDNNVRPFTTNGGIQIPGSAPRTALGVEVDDSIRVDPAEVGPTYVELDLDEYR